MKNYQHLYQEFTKANENHLMMSAHSHHFWPDVTKEAMLQYWDDSARLVDSKWTYFFKNVVPKTQHLLANLLGTQRPGDISFAPNTHDLLSRLLSCFFEKETISILSTKGEFHSFARQSQRLEEWQKCKVDRVEVKTEEQIVSDIQKKLTEHHYDILFLSHVFFETGLVLSDQAIAKIAKSLKEKTTLFCLDTYHSLGALEFTLPNDLSESIFLLGGSYKYLQAGEGLCFMSLAKNHHQLRPLLTGWFAAFDDLEKSAPKKISYAHDGMKFWGSTIDMNSFYRFNAVWELFERENITISDIHHHVMGLQQCFLKSFRKKQSILHASKECFDRENLNAHFLTYECSKDTNMSQLDEKLRASNIVTDHRGPYLRFGFGLHHTNEQMKRLGQRLEQIQ